MLPLQSVRLHVAQKTPAILACQTSYCVSRRFRIRPSTVEAFISAPPSVCGKILFSPPWHVAAVRSVRVSSLTRITYPFAPRGEGGVHTILTIPTSTVG